MLEYLVFHHNEMIAVHKGLVRDLQGYFHTIQCLHKTTFPLSYPATNGYDGIKLTKICVIAFSPGTVIRKIRITVPDMSF